MASTLFDCHGKFFLKQGREHFLKGCVILCIAKFVNEDSNRKIKINFVDFGRRERHAEEIVFHRIAEEERTKQCKVIRVEIYASFSPCNKCCNLISGFVAEHPGCCVRISFSCVYRHTEEIHCAALRTLYENRVVSRLDVFRTAEWLLLRRRGHLALSRYGWWNMRRFDIIWRDILNEILNPTLPVGNAIYYEDSVI